jgi:hypothetical protein
VVSALVIQGADRADEPFAVSKRVPSHRAVDSALDELVSEWRARGAARGMSTGGENLVVRTILWEECAHLPTAEQPVQHDTGFQPAPEIPTDMPVVPQPSARRGVVSSSAQPTDLVLKAGLCGIAASVLTARTLGAGRTDGKRELFKLRKEFYR